MKRKVIVLAFEGAQVLDITGPMEVFAEANVFAKDSPYDVQCVGVECETTRMSNGLHLVTQPYQKVTDSVDTLIVPGGDEGALTALRHNDNFISWLTERIKSSRRIASVCTGAFVLAGLGVLDNRRVCTHWSACRQLRDFAPKSIVDPDSLYIKDGRFYTSAGVTAGIDLSLAMVEEDCGTQVALSIARNLVLYLRRTGGQAQFSEPLRAQTRKSARMQSTVEYVLENPHKNLSVDKLASLAAMSPRHFARIFIEDIGTTPAKFVRNVRLEAVCNLLCSRQVSLKRIAVQTGFSSVDVLTRAFKRHFGVLPDEYQERFGAQSFAQ